MIQDWCHIFINGTGFLNDWKCKNRDLIGPRECELRNAAGPNIQDLHSFRGKLMHSADWDSGELFPSGCFSLTDQAVQVWTGRTRESP